MRLIGEVLDFTCPLSFHIEPVFDGCSLAVVGIVTWRSWRLQRISFSSWGWRRCRKNITPNRFDWILGLQQFNPFMRSGVRWLRLEVLSAIQV